MKNQRGVSLLVLIITIIVVLILAGVMFWQGADTIESSALSAFAQELKDVEIQVSTVRLHNQTAGIGEEKKNKGFYKATVPNPPEEFVSFSENEIYGYVVDLELIEFTTNKRGQDYERYSENIDSNVVEFGKDDVYIYDAKGTVFYAKGYESENVLYHRADDAKKAGPEIVSVTKAVSADKRTVTLTIGVEKANEGKLSVSIGNEAASQTSVEGKTTYFKINVFENKAYVIVAKEEGAGVTTKTVEVTEIEALTFTVTYDANGGENAPEPQTKTERITLKLSSDVPVREGYTFLGWSTDSLATKATYKPNSPFITDTNTILYAVWHFGELRTYSLTYNANGGNNVPLPVNNVSGDVTITSEIPRRDGYGFDGWSKNPKATAGDYHGGDAISINENVVLYAIWIKGMNTIQITVSPEGSGTVSGAGARVEGNTVLISASPSEGYVFKNWTVTSGAVSLSNSRASHATFKMPGNDVSITANFEKANLSVRYDANKGTGAPVSENVSHGTKIEISSVEPTRADYKFLGWSLKANAVDADYHPGDEYTVTDNTYFYAVWAEKVHTYTLKYDTNRGTGNFPEQTKSKGGTIKIYEDEPTRTNFIFKGWGLHPYSLDVVYAPGDIYEKNQDTTLYAIWLDTDVPTVTLSARQENDDLVLVGEGFDEGLIASYAWTMADAEPTEWTNTVEFLENLTQTYDAKQKGTYYFWVKDLTGNIAKASIEVYEVTYDKNEGTGGITSQFKAKDKEMTLTSEKPSKAKYVFLGWSTSNNPGNDEAYVNYAPSSTYSENSDITLKAVWGEAFFSLGSVSGITSIYGNDITVAITPRKYTGTITATISNEEIATVEVANNVMTIKPKDKYGEGIITLVEDAAGNTATYSLIVEKAIRQITLSEPTKTFTYGDSPANITFSYDGEKVDSTVTTSNENVATASVSNYTITIKPENVGSAIITLTVPADEIYKEKTQAIQITVKQKEIIVTPTSGQNKIYDGTEATPTLTYTYVGAANGETPEFTGALTRATGVEVGMYEIKIGTLQLIDKTPFYKDNYTLSLSNTKVYFEIKPKGIALPQAVTPQEYDGRIKYGVGEGADYTRGGEYAKTNVGTYTATVSLKDTKNHVWIDTATNVTRNIPWEITPLTDASVLQIGNISDITYTGSEIKPSVVIKNTVVNSTLVSGTDYTLSYRNNINVGTGTVIITGKGNYAGITLTKDFKIVKANMTVSQAGYSGVYDGAYHSISVKTTWPSSGATIYYSTTELTSSNYNTVGSTSNKEYKDVISQTVYYYITDPNFNDYKGSRTVTITPKSISGVTISNVTDKLYTGSNIVQTPTVTDNELNAVLTSGTDYTVSHSNNLNLGTATITITGKGNYTGTKTKTFTIKGDTITFGITENGATTSVTISKLISVATLQYSYDNSSWTNYTGVITVTEDCTIYAKSVHNGNTLGTNSTPVSVCDHQYSEATCLDDSVCTLCGQFNKAALGHSFTYESQDSKYLRSAATCLDKATYYYKCIRCAEYDTSLWYEFGDPLNHNFASKTVEDKYKKDAATCTAAATYYYKCTRCDVKGTNFYSNGNPLGHVPEGTGSLISAATCTAPAQYQTTCTRCGAVVGSKSVGEKLGHDFTREVATETYKRSDANCTTRATYYYSCTRCGEKGTDYFYYGSVSGHQYTSKSTTATYLKTDATCITPAVYYYKCANCTASSEGDTNTTYEVGDSAGHLWGAWQTVTPATCPVDGSKTKSCTRSGCNATENGTIEATGHVYESKTPTSDYLKDAATCTAPANYYYKCTGCDAKGTTYYSYGDKLSHNYTAETASSTYLASDATCTEAAKYYKSCSRCGATGTSTFTSGNALGHSYGDWVETTAATCTADGEETKTCSRCGATEEQIIPKVGHSYGDWVETTAATCEVEGVETKTCSNCGATETQTTGTVAHIWQSPGSNPDSLYVKSEATCVAGKTVYKCCKWCFIPNYSQTMTVGSKDPNNHNWGAWSVTKNATCTATGTKERSCTRGCGSTESEEVAKLKHVSSGIWQVAAGGYHQTYCKYNCGTVMEQGRCTYVNGKCTGCGVSEDI